MKASLLIILSAFSIVLIGCVQRPVYRLESLDAKDYYKGRELAVKETDSTKVSVQVNEYNGGKVLFDVQIENNSGDKVFIEPGDIYVDEVSPDLVPTDTINQRFNAFDPEKEIDKISGDKEERDNAHTFVTGANIVLAFINVVSDLANKNEEHKANRVGDDINNWANNQTDENINYDNSINNLDSRKDFWENQALRKTDLYPGEQVGGYVEVPGNSQADYLELTIPIDNDVYNFFFKKVLVR